MRKLLLCVLALFCSAFVAQAKESASAISMPEALNDRCYSNVCQCLKYALENEQSSIYVEAIRGYTAAISTLMPMASALAKQKEKTAEELNQVKALNRLLSIWRRKLEELEPGAQLEAYETLKSDYNMKAVYTREALKRNSPIVIQSNLYLCLTAYARAIKQTEKLTLEYRAPDNPDDLNRQCMKKFAVLMDLEGEVRGLNEDARKVLCKLASNTNIEYQVELVSDCLEAKVDGVDGRTLSSIYGVLTDSLPLCHTYWRTYAGLMQQMGDTNGACAIYDRSLTYFPGDFALLYLGAQSAPATPEGAESAIEKLKQCLEMTKGSSAGRICMQLAERYLQCGNMGESYGAAQDAAKMFYLSSDAKGGEYRKARLFSARLALRYGIYDGAIDNLERLLRDEKMDAEVAGVMSEVRYAMFMENPADYENYREAVKAFDRCLSFEPDKPGLYAAKAVINYAYGDMKEAKTQAMRELSVHENSASALAILGYVELADKKNGDKSKARAYFDAALRADPGYEKAKAGLKLCQP